ncbi:MAG: hypothetical protein OEV55_02195 [candidate division Zixibacteria bacterium]|nr:hypothetical protein [candidate division Zixibacteria bacterium]
MNKEILVTLFKVIVVILGLYMAIFYKQNAANAVEWHSKYTGLRTDEKTFRIIFLLGGIVFVIFSLLSIFKIFNY